MRVGIGRGVRDEVRLVTDEVVGVGELVCANLSRDDFGALVVAESIGVARRGVPQCLKKHHHSFLVSSRVRGRFHLQTYSWPSHPTNSSA